MTYKIIQVGNIWELVVAIDGGRTIIRTVGEFRTRGEAENRLLDLNWWNEAQ